MLDLYIRHPTSDPSRSLRHLQLRLATCTYPQQQQISLPINYEPHWVLCLIEPDAKTWYMYMYIHFTVSSPLWYLTARGLCTLQVLFIYYVVCSVQYSCWYSLREKQLSFRKWLVCAVTAASRSARRPSRTCREHCWPTSYRTSPAGSGRHASWRWARLRPRPLLSAKSYCSHQALQLMLHSLPMICLWYGHFKQAGIIIAGLLL